jgi:Na+/phosphate symporter
VFLPTALLVEIWVCVGAFRCGQKFLFEKRNSIVSKFGTVVLVLIALSFSVEGITSAVVVFRMSPETWHQLLNG